jgi:hypothetical protein
MLHQCPRCFSAPDAGGKSSMFPNSFQPVANDSFYACAKRFHYHLEILPFAASLQTSQEAHFRFPLEDVI